jgi:hypothetical protein
MSASMPRLRPQEAAVTDKKRTKKHPSEASSQPVEADAIEGDPPTSSQTPVTPPPSRDPGDPPCEPLHLVKAHKPAPHHHPHGARR